MKNRSEGTRILKTCKAFCAAVLILVAFLIAAWIFDVHIIDQCAALFD